MTPVEQGHADSREWAPAADILLRRIEGSLFARLQTRSLRGCVVMEGGQGLVNLNEAAGEIQCR